jgi:exosortase
MTNSANVSPARAAAIPYLALAAIGIWTVAMSWPVIAGLFETWWVSYAETGHGFIAPPLAAYIVWQQRRELAALPVEGRNWALALVIPSSILLVLSFLVQWVFFSQIALWLILVGTILYLLGAAWVKALGFPLFLLFLTIPPPSFLYTRLTVEMQLLASRLAEMGLEAMGYSVLREGNILQMVGERLNVAEACSGIRSLMTLIFFVLVYGYFVVDRVKSRWLLVAAAMPIAVLANGLRIIVTGVLSQIDRELARGITHEAAGYATLLAGGATCILLEQYLSRTRGKAA